VTCQVLSYLGPIAKPRKAEQRLSQGRPISCKSKTSKKRFTWRREKLWRWDFSKAERNGPQPLGEIH